MSTVKRVYTFGNKQAEGNDKMRELLGGKGANLAEMNLVGIPVPPGIHHHHRSMYGILREGTRRRGRNDTSRSGESD